MMQGRIYKGVGGLYTVKTENSFVECRARGIFRKDGLVLCVGDEVEISDGVIENVLPRKNILSRPPVSNIDRLFVVVANSDPAPDVYNIDKMLVVAEANGIEPVIVFNKVDLPDTESIRDIYRSLPYKSVSITAKTPECFENEINEIRKMISGHICALGGLSGVGKSTLMNALEPSVHHETGDISRKLQRGRHTTRSVELFDICGGTIADTPGFGSIDFETFGIRNRAKLASYFADFAEYRDECMFGDCAHIKEKGCAVLSALNEGNISCSRHESYVRMWQELGEYHSWEDKNDK